MTKRFSTFVLIGLSATLISCPTAKYPTCSSSPVTFPGGKCSSYYYQTDYGPGGATTQALVDCQIDSNRLGGNVVAFHTLAHGIGLRWIDAHTLEVAVPEGIVFSDQRFSQTYSGYPLAYKYRPLIPAEPDYLGCKPSRN